MTQEEFDHLDIGTVIAFHRSDNLYLIVDNVPIEDRVVKELTTYKTFLLKQQQVLCEQAFVASNWYVVS